MGSFFKRVELSAIELAKSHILYATARINLKENDVVSCGVNLYYALFHACISVIVVSPFGDFLEKGIIEWENRLSAPAYRIPCTHREAIDKIQKINRKASSELENLKRIREYLSYGPYMCLDQTDIQHTKPVVYVSEFGDIKRELETKNSYLEVIFKEFAIYIKNNLETEWQFAICLWSRQLMNILRDKLIFREEIEKELSDLWGQLKNEMCSNIKMDS